MEIGIAVLSGVGITMLFFVWMFLFINKQKDKKSAGYSERLFKCWDEANRLSRQRALSLQRIALALETKGTPTPDRKD